MQFYLSITFLPFYVETTVFQDFSLNCDHVFLFWITEYDLIRIKASTFLCAVTIVFDLLYMLLLAFGRKETLNAMNDFTACRIYWSGKATKVVVESHMSSSY